MPESDETLGYVEAALQGQAAGHRLPFAVLEATTGAVLGSTSYHDIVPAIERLEIGYTWYARRVQRTAVNTTAKLLLLSHAFDTLGAALVGWRTDNFNHASQRAIERLGARSLAVDLGDIDGLARAMDGCDAIIFTGGIGEHAYWIREKVLLHFTHSGIRLDHKCNKENKKKIQDSEGSI